MHLREEGQREADETVCSHLQENAGEDDGAGGGRFDVCVGQPGVEGEHWDFDREPEEEGEEEPDGGGERNLRRGLI